MCPTLLRHICFPVSIWIHHTVVHICPNKSIQNFLEASSTLCKYTSFSYCLCTKITKQLRMGGICRGHFVQTLSQSNISKVAALQLAVLRALPGPSLHTSSDRDSAKSLSNLFQWLTQFTIKSLFSWYLLGFSFFCNLSYPFAIHPSRISISSIPLTPPLQKLPGNCFWAHCSWFLYKQSNKRSSTLKFSVVWEILHTFKFLWVTYLASSFAFFKGSSSPYHVGNSKKTWMSLSRYHRQKILHQDP